MLFLVLVTSTKHYWVISAERRRRLPTALLRRNGWVKCQISPATVKFLKRGPSWLTFLGHMKDSLWSMDLFSCESASLRTHWVLVVMDQYSRRIIGFGVHAGTVDGVALCRMFSRAIRWQLKMPKYLSTDNDPLYRFHQWLANLCVLEVTEIKSVPYVPLSHPFVERLIGTLRRECLDRTLFWTATDLQLCE
jgi:transposase InsO family protein